MRWGKKICISVHGEFSLGVGLKGPLLVRGTNVGQALPLYGGTSGQCSVEASTGRSKR